MNQIFPYFTPLTRSEYEYADFFCFHVFLSGREILYEFRSQKAQKKARARRNPLSGPLQAK